jgi:hypothetical protein
LDLTEVIEPSSANSVAYLFQFVLCGIAEDR